MNNMGRNVNDAQYLWFARCLLWMSFFTYLASLFMPVIPKGESSEIFSYGLSALIFGLWAINSGEFSWFANPLLWVTWFMCIGKTPVAATRFGIASFVLAASFLIRHKYFMQCSANNCSHFVEPGYYWWLISIVLATISAKLYYSLNDR